MILARRPSRLQAIRNKWPASRDPDPAAWDEGTSSARHPPRAKRPANAGVSAVPTVAQPPAAALVERPRPLLHPIKDNREGGRSLNDRHTRKGGLVIWVVDFESGHPPFEPAFRVSSRSSWPESSTTRRTGRQVWAHPNRAGYLANGDGDRPGICLKLSGDEFSQFGRWPGPFQTNRPFKEGTARAT